MIPNFLRLPGLFFQGRRSNTAADQQAHPHQPRLNKKGPMIFAIT